MPQQLIVISILRTLYEARSKFGVAEKTTSDMYCTSTVTEIVRPVAGET